jgi:cytochrome P450
MSAEHPNRHLAFASGIHVCAGMNVARLEGRIALERFLARFPDYRLDGRARPLAARAVSRVRVAAGCTVELTAGGRQ